MRLLRRAIESQNMDLAAHTIVLAAARVLQGRGNPNAKAKKKKRVSAEQSKRT